MATKEVRVAKDKGCCKLWCPTSFVEASPSVIAAICNGCGSAESKFDFVPDTIYCLDISEACLIHDWMYHFGRTEMDKKEADRVFYSNLLRLIEARGGVLEWMRKRRALKYYRAVQLFGDAAFYATKSEQ